MSSPLWTGRSSPQTSVRDSGRRRAAEITPQRLALALNFPAIILLAALIAYPLCYAFFLAFHRVGVRELRSGELPFVGLSNFLALFQDDAFRLSLAHSFVFVVLAVVLETALGIVIALIINERRVKISAVTRVLVLIPWAVPPIVNGLLWSFIYNSKYGYLNAALYNLGLIDDFVQWTGNPSLALYLVVLPYVWRTTPFAVLLFHAALQGIPDVLYEAAEVDGANAWHRFRGITLPLLSPTVVVVLVLRTTFAFMVFDEIFALTQGGPGNATWVVAWYTYRSAFQPPFEMGIAAASAFVTAAIIGIFAVVYVRLLSRQVQYS